VETVEGRYARYSACWKVLMDGIAKLGLECLVPSEYQSHLITAITSRPIHAIASKSSTTTPVSWSSRIYPGKLAEANTFRIANIGDIKPAEMERFVHVLGEYMESIR